jgi:anthranilate synthase/phosphoribosyltransferase
MLLLIDNYDSFTYNLYQYLSELGEDVRVVRNDKITIAEIERINPERIIISPGPSTPLQAGISNDVIKYFGNRLPILGVCLGHECIGHVYGGSIVRAREIMHGKASSILHKSQGVFTGLTNPFSAIRYHSLTVDREKLPDCLEVTAWTDDGTIMGLRHRQFPVEGVQFHPESFMTQNGKELLNNFIKKKHKTIKDMIQKLTSGQSLTEEEAASSMEEIMNGTATPAQFGAFVTTLRFKGETVEEIIGFARTMRAKAVPIAVTGNVVDTCGTGGDGAHTFNISTAAAFVAAGAGLKIAKHGNRAMSSQCGSADVLEALGVKIELNAEQVKKCIEQVGIGFLFAPAFHPAMKYAASPRREIGIRTVFNILGPLTNPAGAKAQVIGVPDKPIMKKIALVLQGLGCHHALVVHGEDGLDEITNTDRTSICELNNGKILEYSISPQDFGFSTASPENLKGGTASENANIILNVMANVPSPRRDIVIMNAAAALLAGDAVNTISEGVTLAKSTISSGKAMVKLNQLIELSKRLTRE